MYNYDLISESLYTKSLGKTFVQFEEVSSLHGKSKNISENCPDGMLVLSAKQLGFRSRDNKIEFPDNIEMLLMSMIFKTKKDLTEELLQTVTASVCEVLALICDNSNVKIKWPNEVFIDDKKICSVLVEKHTKKGIDNAIVSIYINDRLSIDQNDTVVPNCNDFAVLKDYVNDDFLREELISELLNKIEELYEEFMFTKQLATVSDIFNKSNMFSSNKVLVNKIGKKTTAEVVIFGIDKKGRLIVCDSMGNKSILKYDEYEIKE